MSEMIRLTGLWLNESKDGQKYFSGSIGQAKLLIFKNTRKREGSKDADYVAYIAPSVKRQESDQGEDDEGPIPF